MKMPIVNANAKQLREEWEETSTDEGGYSCIESAVKSDNFC